MSSEKHYTPTAPATGENAPAIVLSAGLAALAIGEAIFLLAALILPATAIQNDASFFIPSLLGIVLVFIGTLLIAGGLIGLKAVHWSVALGVLAIGWFAAYGFFWPDWLLPPITNPFRPFIGQITLGGLVLVLCLLMLLKRGPRVWSLLWRSLVIAGIVAVIAIALLAWLYFRIA